MEIGKTLEIIKDDKSPYQSPNTRLVSAARAVGFNWGIEKPYMDSIEKLEDGTAKRTVSWVIDGDQKVPFVWAQKNEDGIARIKEEELTFSEFRKRYLDLEWCAENDDHPISYLRAAHRQHAKMLKAIKTLPQHTVIRKGKRMDSIPTDASDEEKAKILKMLG